MCFINNAESISLRGLTDEDKNSLHKWMDRGPLCAGMLDCC